MSEAQSDTPETGPLTMADAVAQLSQAPLPGNEPEAEEAPEVAAEAEPEEVQEEVTEPEPAAEDDGPQILTLDDYGEVVISLGEGSETTLKELADGSLRQSDYTRKTTELADAKKQFEAEKQAQLQEIADLKSQLNDQLSSAVEQEPDWEKLAEEDPLNFPIEQARWQKKKAQADQVRQEMEAQRKAQNADFIRQTAAIAQEKMPEWLDTGKFDEGAKARFDAALAAGFTQAEYEATTDFRLAVLLEKAARYDAQVSKAKITEKKLAKAPKVLKPGAQKTTQEVKDDQDAALRKRLKKPMTTNEALAILSRG